MNYNVLDDQSRNIEKESPTGEICDSLAFSQYVYASKTWFVFWDPGACWTN